MAISTYLANALLDHTLRNTAYTSPTTVYLSLHSGDPGNTGASELAAANGYARSACAFDAAASKATTNTAAEVFTNTGSAWSAATYWGIWDAASAGNFLFGGALGTSKTIGASDTGTFAIGAADVTLT